LIVCLFVYTEESGQSQKTQSGQAKSTQESRNEKKIEQFAACGAGTAMKFCPENM